MNIGSVDSIYSIEIIEIGIIILMAIWQHQPELSRMSKFRSTENSDIPKGISGIEIACLRLVR